MSFKLLLKQSFRSLSKKFRLYLSLIIFLFVAFSILAGTGTYFTTYRNEMNKVLYQGKDENFEIPKFRFLSANSSNSDAAVFMFSPKGQTQFLDFANKLNSKDNTNNQTNDSNDGGDAHPAKLGANFIDDLGQNLGDVSLVNGDFNVSNLVANTQRWGHNLMQMFLSQQLRENLNTQIGIRETLSGTVGKHRNITLQIRPLSEGDEASPFFNNGLNEITNYRNSKHHQKIVNKKLKEGKKPFLLSQNYLRYTDSKIGDDISIIVNNTPYDGFISGVASDKYHLFFSNDSAEAFVDLKTLGEMSSGDYISAQQIIGYLPISDSSNSFDNGAEFNIAYNKVNHLLLSNGNDPNALFMRVDQHMASPLVSQIDESSSVIGFYHEPLSLYMGFMAVLIVVLVILVIIVSYFIIDESIRSEKKTLWFLKSLGVNNFKLSLLNSMAAIVPLVIALALTIPGTMLIMEFFTIAITTDYSFSVPWYALTWVFAVILVCLLIGIIIIFIAINEGLISGRGLSIQSTDKMSGFQRWLANWTNPIIKKANGKFRVGFAFIKQNLIKNFVTFILFLVVFSITLFGVQFNRSITNQETSYQKWMGDYHAISTLSSKQTITKDGKDTTYKMIDEDGTDGLHSLQAEDKKHFVKDEGYTAKAGVEDNKHLGTAYDYDGFKYIMENWFNGIDEANQTAKDFLNSHYDDVVKDYPIINSNTHQVVSLPSDPGYYRELITRVSVIFASRKQTIPGVASPFFTYDQARKMWERINNSQDPNDWLTFGENINKVIYGNKYVGELAEKDQMNEKTTSAPDSVTSLAQWSLRQMRDISLWDVNSEYVKTLLIMEDKLSTENKESIDAAIKGLLQDLPATMKPALQSIVSSITSQKNIFGVKNPSLGINFGNIVKFSNRDKTKSAVAMQANYKGTPLFAYGMDNDQQPFTTKIKIPQFTGKLHTEKGTDGITYDVIDSEFSAISKNQHRWQIGDIVPLDTTQSGMKLKTDGKTVKGHYLALKITGFEQHDSVLTEAFFDKKALDWYIENEVQLDPSFPKALPSLDNTFYTTAAVPYFLQHVTVPHMDGEGTSIDDYIYKLDTFTSDHKTTALITKVFADTVNSYSSLMTKIIILLVVIAIAISSIIITLIMFENKKTILLFKAMGYQKREVIWYIISGYLIASIAALLGSFGISAGATFGLAPTFATKIFLQLIFTTYWLWFVLGIIITVGFMALVIISIVTYTRILKPRDAFATL